MTTKHLQCTSCARLTKFMVEPGMRLGYHAFHCFNCGRPQKYGVTPRDIARARGMTGKVIVESIT